MDIDTELWKGWDPDIGTILITDSYLKDDYMKIRNAVRQLNKQVKLLNLMIECLPEEMKDQFARRVGLAVLAEADLGTE